MLPFTIPTIFFNKDEVVFTPPNNSDKACVIPANIQFEDAPVSDEPLRKESDEQPSPTSNNDAISEEDECPFHVVHPYPAWFRSDSSGDLNSVSESQAGVDWRMTSNFNSTPDGGSGSIPSSDPPIAAFHPVV